IDLIRGFGMLKRVFGALFGAVLLLAVAVSPAAAGSNSGRVENRAGAPVKVDCSYNGKTPRADHTLYEKRSGKKYVSKQFKDCSDADAFKLTRDKRCLALYPLFGSSMLVKADPGHWFKLSG